MPRVGSKQRMVRALGGDPAGDRHLLLVAAGEPLHLALGAGVDLQPLDGAVDAARSRPHVDRAPVPSRALNGRAMFSRTERCMRRRLGAVAGDEDEAGADGVGRMGEAARPAVDLDAAARGADRAGEGAEELVLALALERDDAE